MKSGLEICKRKIWFHELSVIVLSFSLLENGSFATGFAAASGPYSVTKKLSIILSYGDYLWQIPLLWEARSWQKLRHWLAVTNFIDKLTRLTRSWQGIKPRGCEVDGGEEGSQRGPRGWPYRAISSGLGLDRVRPAWLIESLVKRQGWAPARRCFPKKPYTVHEPSPKLGSGWARQARGARA